MTPAAAPIPTHTTTTTANDLENRRQMRWQEEDCDATVPCVMSSSSSSGSSEQGRQSVREYLEQFILGHAAEPHRSVFSDSTADSHDTFHHTHLADTTGHCPWAPMGDHNALPQDQDEQREDLSSHARPWTSTSKKDMIDLVTPPPNSEKPSTPVSTSNVAQSSRRIETTPPWWPPTPHAMASTEKNNHPELVNHNIYSMQPSTSPFHPFENAEDLFLEQRQREMDAQRARRLHLQIQRQLSLRRQRQQLREREAASVEPESIPKHSSSFTSHPSTSSPKRLATKLSASSDEIDVDRLLDEVFSKSPPLSSKLPVTDAREAVEKKQQQLRHASASAHSPVAVPVANEKEKEDRGQSSTTKENKEKEQVCEEDERTNKDRKRKEVAKGGGQARHTTESEQGTSQATATVEGDREGEDEGMAFKKAKRLKRPPPFWLQGVPDTEVGKLFKRYEDRYWAMEVEGEGVTGPFFKAPRYLSHAERTLFRKWGRRFTEIVASRSKSRTEKNRQYRLRKWGPPGDAGQSTETQRRTKEIAMLRKYLNERLHALLKGETKGWTTRNTELMQKLAEMRPLQASDRTVELYRAFLAMNKGMKSCIDLPQE